MISHAEHCVCCGEVIPEGKMVCPECERMVKGVYDEETEVLDIFAGGGQTDNADVYEECETDCIWDEDCSTCPYFDGCSAIDGGGWD